MTLTRANIFSLNAAMRPSGVSSVVTERRMAAVSFADAARRLVLGMTALGKRLADGISSISNHFFARSTIATGLRSIPARTLEDGWFERQQTPTGATWSERPRRVELHRMHALASYWGASKIVPACRW